MFKKSFAFNFVETDEFVFSGFLDISKVRKNSFYLTEIFCNIRKAFTLTFDQK